MRYKGLKGKAWEAVRRYIKKRDKNCYTCEKKNLIINGYKADCGHYLPIAIVGSNNRLSWDERQIHLQCGRCNGAGQGEQSSYRRHLVRDYGEKVVAELEARRYKIDPIKDWQTVIDHYNALYEQT